MIPSQRQTGDRGHNKVPCWTASSHNHRLYVSEIIVGGAYGYIGGVGTVLERGEGRVDWIGDKTRYGVYSGMEEGLERTQGVKIQETLVNRPPVNWVKLHRVTRHMEY